jgi:hypothetical protein
VIIRRNFQNHNISKTILCLWIFSFSSNPFNRK